MKPQNDLFSYYLDELAYLRKMGGRFAQDHPKVAARLQLEPTDCADPHVERLLEGFALLTSRLQREIDGSFPQVSQSLLEILYPQLVRPVPSMSIARFQARAGEGKMSTAYRIAQHTQLIARSSAGHVCRFRTGAPVELWPVEISRADFPTPGRYAFLDQNPEVAGVLRLSLRGAPGPLSDLEMDRLRFYINGDRALTPGLVELIFLHLKGIALVGDGNSKQAVMLDKSCLSQGGFSDDEALIPYPPVSHKGYRLLQEYFCFPQKFRFFDVCGLSQRGAVKELDLLLLFNKAPGSLVVDAENFPLGCAPIINIFPYVTDPVIVDERSFEYPLIPDAGRQRTTEIHAIENISLSPQPGKEKARIPPYYSYSHSDSDQDGVYWMARRRRSLQRDMAGSDMMLSLVDLKGAPSPPVKRILYAHVLCTNRGLAAEIPSGAALQMDCPSPLATASCLTKPTPPVFPDLGADGHWRLISHLSLNYLSLSNGEESLAALKEMLRLYVPSGSLDPDKQIRGIRSLSCRPITHHLGSESWRGHCRGLEVALTFDANYYTGSGFYLLGSVLHHFFGMYASINSFTQLAVYRDGQKGIWKKWPPRAGEKPLL